MTALLCVQNVETWYGPVNAIRGISLEVQPGRIVAVLGANGAGKTTLLNTIAGVTNPLKGSIEFEGNQIEGLDVDEVARRGLILVPEGRQVFPFLTVAENLQMGAFARRHDARVALDIDKVYGWFPRLLERCDQQAGLLSGGEQQMLAIGRAYMGSPKLLMLDEPSLGLSPLLTKEIFSIVKRISIDAGIAVLVVEQNAAIALSTADDGYIVELGRIVAADTCKNLVCRADVKDFYLGGTTERLSNGPDRVLRPARRRKSWH
ncbi:ABC transporter ATP-binding protein [Caballeronia sp. 15715]|uniref:ABC transporter ATP-binding protein n=1 Tax=Caballeronia sp. 15715 TaxID=3391030 RepID=UPI0039E6104E